MCVACVEHGTMAAVATEVCPAGEPAAVLTWDERRRIYEWELASGILVRCRDCGMVYRPSHSEEAITRRGCCTGCEAGWLENEILGPLVERLGRKGARKALRKLAAGK